MPTNESVLLIGACRGLGLATTQEYLERASRVVAEVLLGDGVARPRAAPDQEHALVRGRGSGRTRLG